MHVRVHVRVRVRVYMSTSAHEVYKRAINPLEPELQVVVATCHEY